MLAMQESVFGNGRGPSVDSTLAALADGDTELWLAEVDGGGRAAPAGCRSCRAPSSPASGAAPRCPSTAGAGSTGPLVAARARAAVERGVRFLHSDSTDMSRPILERSGLVAVTTTTPYVWTR